jgi:hypothetical protein
MLIMAISGFAAVMVSTKLQSIYITTKLDDRVRAKAIAEAGANEAYTRLEENWDARLNDDAFPQTAFGNGHYDVTVTPLTNNAAIISSAGHYGKSDELAILDISLFDKTPGGGAPSAAIPIGDYSILCNDLFHFGGTGNIYSTNGQSRIHGNALINIKGNAGVNISLESSTKIKISNNKTITGDITAPILQYNASKVTITGTATVGPVPFQTIPDIDLTPWYNWANDHGEVHNGFNFSGGTYTANGGVIWVNGDAMISGGPGTTINGCIVATGEIHFGGQADLNPPPNSFSLAARDSRVKLTTSGTVGCGLIYTKTGDVEHSANGTVYGQIISAGGIRKTGNSDILTYCQVELIPPGNTSSNSITQLEVTAWQW